jgi:hypothetical protein
MKQVVAALQNADHRLDHESYVNDDLQTVLWHDALVDDGLPASIQNQRTETDP